ncbi:thioredoxin family protein [Clostridium sp.]|uniref:thioredoxin family protein n=1 Tax=Clostridium sp. TaxID=1506 RepID=UPI002FDE5360
MKKIICMATICVLIIGAFSHIYLSNKRTLYKDISPIEFNNIINSHKSVYVVFYSVNCISCRKLEKEIEKLKEEGYKIENLTLYGLNVDKYYDKKLMNKYNIDGVPVIIKYKNGIVEDSLSTNIDDTDIIKFLKLNME